MILIGLIFLVSFSYQCNIPSCYTDNQVTALFQNIESFQPTNVSQVDLSNYIQLCPGTQTEILSFNITLGTWTWLSEWSQINTNPNGWYTNITLKLYNMEPFVNLTRITRQVQVPWRPEPSEFCNFLEYAGSDFRCHTVLDFTMTWNFNSVSHFVLPNFAFEITVNDAHQPGYNPNPGPWNSNSIGTQTNVVNLVLNLTPCPTNGF